MPLLITATICQHLAAARWRLCCGGEFGLHSDLHQTDSAQPPSWSRNTFLQQYAYHVWQLLQPTAEIYCTMIALLQFGNALDEPTWRVGSECVHCAWVRPGDIDTPAGRLDRCDAAGCCPGPSALVRFGSPACRLARQKGASWGLKMSIKPLTPSAPPHTPLHCIPTHCLAVGVSWPQTRQSHYVHLYPAWVSTTARDEVEGCCRHSGLM